MKTNKIFKLLALVLALAMILSVAGCAGSGKEESSTTNESSTVEESSTSSEEESSGEETKTYPKDGPDPTDEHYSFTIYANYDWWSVQPWGDDEITAYWNDLFNIDVTWTKPDSDASAKLNLMVTGGDYPEVIYMDRNSDFEKVARMGIFVDLNTLFYEGCTYETDISEATRNLISVDGGLYIFPCWPRKGATGGNDSWQVLRSIYEAHDSPELNTLEDIHDYVLSIKEAGDKNTAGETVIPFQTGETSDGTYLLSCFLRSTGRPARPQSWWSQQEGGSDAEYIFAFEDEYVIKAIKEANKWYNEGLFPATVFTDSADQRKEKFTTARVGVLYYDFSQDSVFKYNQIVEDTMDDRYLVLGWDLPDYPIYPTFSDAEYPAFGDENGTVGGGGPCITTNAENPQRIFDLFCHMWSKQGSIEMMYGPQGHLWEELDENGNPILLVPEAEIPAEEKNAVGCWLWATPAHADNVDSTKFAVNNMAPEESRDWTVSLQANLFSPDETDDDPISLPGQKYICDDNTNVYNAIDAASDLGVSRQLISDKCAGNLPKMMMAATEDEFNALLEETIEYANQNGKDEITAIYNEVHAANIEAAGYSYYDLFYEAYNK